jgi:hypothetical protein
MKQVSKNKYKLFLDDARKIGARNYVGYAEYRAENDPGFFRWLFDNLSIEDYTLPDDFEDAYEKFIEQLKNEKTT